MTHGRHRQSFDVPSACARVTPARVTTGFTATVPNAKSCRKLRRHLVTTSHSYQFQSSGYSNTGSGLAVYAVTAVDGRVSYMAIKPRAFSCSSRTTAKVNGRRHQLADIS